MKNHWRLSDRFSAVHQSVHEKGGFSERTCAVREYSACDVAVFGAESIVSEACHVHDECIVGTGGTIIASSPIGDGQWRNIT
jgi:carbonic anhydrase/acetyltransferase-like protein (isoleucine patch superfamily)